MPISKEIRAEIESYRLLSAAQLMRRIEIEIQPRYQNHYIADFMVWLWNKFREPTPELEQARASLQLAFPEAKRAARYLSELKLKLCKHSSFCKELDGMESLPFEEKIQVIAEKYVLEYQPTRYRIRISPILVALCIVAFDPRTFCGCSDE